MICSGWRRKENICCHSKVVVAAAGLCTCLFDHHRKLFADSFLELYTPLLGTRIADLQPLPVFVKAVVIRFVGYTHTYTVEVVVGGPPTINMSMSFEVVSRNLAIDNCPI